MKAILLITGKVVDVTPLPDDPYSWGIYQFPLVVVKGKIQLLIVPKEQVEIIQTRTDAQHN